jgi:glutamyl-tRNA synthetase
MNAPLGSQVRVRIAPSPTGPLHVGTARSALFNELYARRHGGKFILRVEDTDRERSRKEYEEEILAGLRWLGLAWDEGPYHQSERRDEHSRAIKALLAQGLAYQHEGSKAVTLHVETQKVAFDDLVRGQVKVHTDTWGGDFVIARAPDDPLYHLAVVLDDAAQNITHVIRGEDHLTNTARHILLQRALGIATPQYAHMPLLLDEKRRKLSKRSGEVGLLAYREMGYLPEAMLNYLALLGWNPGDDREYFTHEELAREFSLARVQKGGAIFSVEKLTSMNRKYMADKNPEELLGEFISYYESLPADHSEKKRIAPYDFTDQDYWVKAIATEQERAPTLYGLMAALEFFQADWEPVYATKLSWRKSTGEETLRALAALRDTLAALPAAPFSAKKLQEELLRWIDENNLDRGVVLWPMRVALTGRDASPGPFEVAAVLGKEETVARIDRALAQLKSDVA